jgi:ATP-dependent Lon protease
MELPMMAIREVVFFPGMMTPFIVGRAASVPALNEAISGDKKIFLVTQRDAAVDNPTPDEIFRVGTIANIVQSLKLPDGNIKILVEGVERAEVISISDAGGCFRATVRTATHRVEPAVESGLRLDALVSRVRALCGRHCEGAVRWRSGDSDDPGTLADTVGASLLVTFDDKQELLEIFDPVERLTRVAEVLGHRHVDVPISTAVLTRWAESCLAMNRLGTLLRQEMEGPNRSQRARDLVGRAQRLARHLADELVVYGAHNPADESGAKS